MSLRKWGLRFVSRWKSYFKFCFVSKEKSTVGNAVKRRRPKGFTLTPHLSLILLASSEKGILFLLVACLFFDSFSFHFFFLISKLFNSKLQVTEYSNWDYFGQILILFYRKYLYFKGIIVRLFHAAVSSFDLTLVWADLSKPQLFLPTCVVIKGTSVVEYFLRERRTGDQKRWNCFIQYLFETIFALLKWRNC